MDSIYSYCLNILLSFEDIHEKLRDVCKGHNCEHCPLYSTKENDMGCVRGIYLSVQNGLKETILTNMLKKKEEEKEEKDK